ncbi:hypothetical protein FVEN_g12830 [Fusarium venenatum]|nr:hypothetical protein FVEN_g12830 [Fusarium venenatum]
MLALTAGEMHNLSHGHTDALIIANIGSLLLPVWKVSQEREFQVMVAAHGRRQDPGTARGMRLIQFWAKEASRQLHEGKLLSQNRILSLHHDS